MRGILYPRFSDRIWREVEETGFDRGLAAAGRQKFFKKSQPEAREATGAGGAEDKAVGLFLAVDARRRGWPVVGINRHLSGDGLRGMSGIVTLRLR